MADSEITGLPVIAAIEAEDLIAAVDDPSVTPVTSQATITQVATFLASNTTTLTNHSIDWANNTMTFTSAEILAACSDETGTGSLVFATSPTLVTPALGTPSALVLTNATGLPPAGVTGIAAVQTDNLSVFASTTSAQLAAVISNETGSGLLVFGTSPTIVTPIIASFLNATHDHTNAAGGGTITAAAISDFSTSVAATTSVTANTAKVTNATHTGDATGDTALTIASGVVTLAKMADIATTRFIGRVTAATGVPEALTGTQATTLLDTFTSALQGLVPASSGGTTNFLRADGSFAAPPDTGATSLDELSDVTIATAAATQILIYNAGATAMENKTMSGDATLAASGALTIASNFATSTDDLSFFSSTTSLQLLGVISDETGSGSLVFGTSPTIVTPTIASFTNATHDHADATGGGQLLSTTALSDTANIAYLNTANTFGAFLNSFAASSMRIPLSATPTMAVDGDFAIDTTVTDFSHGVMKYFDGEELGVVAMPIAQFTTPTDGNVVAYNATNDEFELIAAGAGDMILASAQTVTGAKTFDSGTLILSGATSGTTIFNAAAVAGSTTITLPGTTGTVVITGLASQITIGTEVTGASTALTDTASIARSTDNLSFFATTTSAQLLALLSDETGTGSAVFATSPTLVTPLLGTPTSGVMTNVTGTASGLTAGNVTTNANLTGDVTSIGNATTLGTSVVGLSNMATAAKTEVIAVSASDETTVLTTGTAKTTFRMPYAFTLTDIRASLTTAPTTSGLFTVDVNDDGTSIMTTNKLTIDLTEKTTETAATAPVLTDTALANDAEITIDIDVISGGATEAGLKVYLIGFQT